MTAENGKAAHYRIDNLEQDIHEIKDMLQASNAKFDDFLKVRQEYVERIVRLEERLGFVQKIVYGAIGLLASAEVAGIIYVLQKTTGG